MSKNKTQPAANASASAYDGIGNLSVSSVATGGLPAVVTSYYANSLNQYESIWSADSDAWLEHSENGEMSRFGDRGFLYDAKSRLVTVGEWVFDVERYLAGDYDDYYDLWSIVGVSNRYDHIDRRVQKISPAATHIFFYDGWMLIKEIVANTNGTTDVIEYYWGKDLSGTLQGAGGVGGLLYLTVSDSSAPNSSTRQLYVPFYDAYGNVMGYWDAQGNVVAQYTYDAFGKLIASSGPLADVFSIRYSTKYFDVETGHYYYGYRFYNPILMRWLTRDPLEEDDGDNLYLFCNNSSSYVVDTDGRRTWTEATAVNELRDKIREMREKGYSFAADALEHYIGNHSSNIDLSRYASQIYNDSGWQQSFIESVIVELKKKDPKGTNKKVEIGDIEHKGAFTGNLQTGRIDNMFRQMFSHRFQPYHDMGLFYALYGSHYSYIGTASWCRKSECNFLSMSFHADVETDLEVVSWDPLSYGGSGIRDIAPSYSAARYLQDTHGYRTNFIYLKWKEKGTWRMTTYSSARGSYTYTHRRSAK